MNRNKRKLYETIKNSISIDFQKALYEAEKEDKYANASPREKVNAWKNGDRDINLKACSPDKLRKYYQLAQDMDFEEGAYEIEQVAKSHNVNLNKKTDENCCGCCGGNCKCGKHTYRDNNGDFNFEEALDDTTLNEGWRDLALAGLMATSGLSAHANTNNNVEYKDNPKTKIEYRDSYDNDKFFSQHDIREIGGRYYDVRGTRCANILDYKSNKNIFSVTYDNYAYNIKEVDEVMKKDYASYVKKCDIREEEPETFDNWIKSNFKTSILKVKPFFENPWMRPDPAQFADINEGWREHAMGVAMGAMALGSGMGLTSCEYNEPYRRPDVQEQTWTDETTNQRVFRSSSNKDNSDLYSTQWEESYGKSGVAWLVLNSKTGTVKQMVVKLSNYSDYKEVKLVFYGDYTFQEIQNIDDLSKLKILYEMTSYNDYNSTKTVKSLYPSGSYKIDEYKNNKIVNSSDGEIKDASNSYVKTGRTADREYVLNGYTDILDKLPEYFDVFENYVTTANFY